MTPERPTCREQDAITDAAAYWCMRLHAPDCSTLERQAFARWLDEDPRHAVEYRAMEQIWHTTDLLPRTPFVLEPDPIEPRGRLGATPLRRLATAAVIGLLGLPSAAWLGWEQGWVPNAYQHLESTDQVRSVQLSDGSQVQLNLDTELRFFNFKDQRRVALVKGEAFFEVRHDSAHPFIVRAGNGQTRVTGTGFNVWKYQDQVTVTLVEGSVQVSHDGGTGGHRLDPGMQAHYQAGDFEPQLSQTADNGNSLAWRTGHLVLDNLTLAEALPSINRYLARPLRLADRTVGQIRISGTYSTRDIEGLVRTLPKVLPVYLTRSQDGSTVLNRISPAPSRG
ncbi:FecR family protein [Pseudomonas entomophila]|uniref:FecR family protein n=1 Tax=Pseudomonas entomophila TaxID=312306 RepID=UPI003EC0BEF9